MVSITFNEQTLQYISLFERVTRTRVRDCMETDEKIIFIVAEGQISKAIGKGGITITKLRNMMKKPIQVIEYSDNPEKFLKNIFRNYNVKKVEIEPHDKIIHATVTVDAKEKARAIGKEGKNLKLARNIIARHHNIQSVSVA
jgi:N utilization substance protein A